MADLPLVVCGPLLRRVDAGHVSVWIALSKSADVTVHVFAGRAESTGPGTGSMPEIAAGMRATRPFGAKLHVVVVDVAVAGLAPFSRFSYDVVVDADGRKHGLLALGLLKDGTGMPKVLALGYDEGMLPSFVTASDRIDGLRIAHTSCRKPHGPGPDALAWLDEVVEKGLGQQNDALQQLFLTGDQIYADDVAGTLLPVLHAVGEELIGGVETMPVGATSIPATMDSLPADRRQRTVRALAKFTTTEGHSHLITLGEYMAMYCLTWSPALWQGRTLESVETVLNAALGPQAAKTEPTPWEDAANPAEMKKDRERRLRGEHHHARVWLGGLPKVARVLANVPTFMIFDDHEITDDWNLTEAWRQRVINAPFGKAILRNGLMAYTVFQAWGNDPGAFRHEDPQNGPAVPKAEWSAAEKLLVAIGDVTSTPGGALDAVLAEVDGLLGLKEPLGVPQVVFNYQVPGALHSVRVLDTRTRRTYRASRNAPPRLVGSTLDQQLPAAEVGDPRDLVIVISPVPVLFPRLFEAIAQPVGAAFLDLKAHLSGRTEPEVPGAVTGLRGSEKLDLEGWRADEVHHEELLARLATYPRAVVLSGDVHFASTLFMDYWTGTRRTRIVQCTSSAAKNPWPSAARSGLRMMRIGQHALRGVPAERLGWKAGHGIQLPPAASIRPGRRGRLLRTPVIVPAGDWPAGTTVGTQPDWRWRLEVARDVRDRTELPIGAPEVPVLSWDAADPIVSISKMASSHQHLSTQPRDPVRQMVFSDNVGVVGFDADGTDHRVSHILFSEDLQGDGDEFTEHVVVFAPSQTPMAPALGTV